MVYIKFHKLTSNRFRFFALTRISFITCKKVIVIICKNFLQFHFIIYVLVAGFEERDSPDPSLEGDDGFVGVPSPIRNEYI
jgi:hypothetical protein